jgi:hypothetical protein
VAAETNSPGWGSGNDITLDDNTTVVFMVAKFSDAAAAYIALGTNAWGTNSFSYVYGKIALTPATGGDVEIVSNYWVSGSAATSMQRYVTWPQPQTQPVNTGHGWQYAAWQGFYGTNLDNYLARPSKFHSISNALLSGVTALDASQLRGAGKFTGDGGALTNLNLSVSYMPTNGLATWPTNAQSPGGAAWVNSNSFLYVLQSGPGSAAWVSTNKIGK